jgi:hypothetical protein
LDAQHHPASQDPPQRYQQVRRSEKESMEARDRRILEFPLTMSAREVAKALKAEGCYSKRTTVYHIEYRVRQLREKDSGKVPGSFLVGRSERAVSMTEHFGYDEDEYRSAKATAQEQIQ